MSNWTHVAGIVRINLIRFEQVKDSECFDWLSGIFGKEVRFKSSSTLWDEAYEHPERFLPLGSEGSLTMSVWINPDVSSIAAITVSIFGDLRDHDSPDEIIDWFKDKCENSDLSIRNAVITVDNSYNGTRTWTYDE